MRDYLVKRILQAFAVVLCISAITFFVLNIVPGDPVRIMMGDNADDATVEQVRHSMGLDKPVLEQYTQWFAKLVHGDFGESYTQHKPVSALIAKALVVTLTLALSSYIVALVVGIGVGVCAAVYHGKAIDRALMSLAVFGISAPSFWVAIVIQIIFALNLRWFPLSGVKNALSFVLPTCALSCRYAASIARVTRTAMVDQLGQDFMRTAAAKGLSGVRIIICHGLRCALIPIITIAGAQLGDILCGSLITESVFAMPGMGKLILDAITARDLPLIEGVVMYISILCVFVYLLVDVLYTVVDPRIRLAKDKEE